MSAVVQSVIAWSCSRERWWAAGRAALLMGAMLPLLGAKARAANTYWALDGSYSIDLPPGWTRVPDATVQRVMRMVLQPGQSTRQMEAMFEAPGQAPFTYPYMGIKEFNYPHDRQPSERDIHSLINSFSAVSVKQVFNKTLTPAANKMIQGGAVGAGTYDPVRKTFRVPLTINVAGNGQVNEVLLGFLGRHKAVLIAFYDRPDALESWQPTISALPNGFRFAPGQEFHTGMSGRTLALIAAIGSAVLVGIIVLVVLLIIRVAGKRSRVAPPAYAPFAGVAPVPPLPFASALPLPPPSFASPPPLPEEAKTAPPLPPLDKGL